MQDPDTCHWRGTPEPRPPSAMTSGPVQVLPEATYTRLAPPREAVKAYAVQAQQAHEVFTRAFEVFNDQRKHYGDPVSVEPLAVALRALELKAHLTGLIHGV